MPKYTPPQPTLRDLRIDNRQVSILVWHDGSEKPNYNGGKYLVETTARDGQVDVARFEGGFWNHALGAGIVRWAEWPELP